MDIPDLVKGALGDEEIQAGVSLGDEDAVCLTPTRTLVYRGEGLLSDEQVEEYSHDIEQLAVSEGRRKTKFTMQYIDGTESFTVPANRGDKVLALFLEGVLRLDGVIESRESVAGVYRFSELTLIITEGRLIKHIGNQVWTEDFEVYSYGDVTGLEFERASVATSIALSVDGRPQRVKVPNDKAPVVRQTLEEALFGYYDVGSLDELNRIVGADDAVETGGVESTETDDDGFAFGDDFDPLVSDEDDDLTEPVETADRPGGDAFSEEPAEAQQPTQSGGPADQSTEPVADQQAESATDRQADAPADRSSGGAEPSASASGSTDAGAERGVDQTGESEATEQSRPSSPGQQHSSESGGQQSPGSGQQQPSDSGPQQSSDRTSSEPQSREASTTDAAASTPDGQQAGGSAADQPDRSAQERASTANDGQDSAGQSPAESGQSATGPTTDKDAGAGAPDRSAGQESGGQSTSTSVSTPTSATGESADGQPITREEYEALAGRVEELTDAVDRQNELLKRQHRALKRLVQQNQQSE